MKLPMTKGMDLMPSELASEQAPSSNRQNSSLQYQNNLHICWK
jgi:hypothetical protein